MHKIFYYLSLFTLCNGCLEVSAIEAAKPVSQSICLTAEIDDVAEEALARFNVPGVAVAVVLDDQVILSRGYGLRNVRDGLPVTEHTLFPIASCTKAFTALMLSQLAQTGIIALDDPVQKYIPEFSLVNNQVAKILTIRDILAHRTGYARHDPVWFFSEISRSTVLDFFQHMEPTCGLRETFHYNNLMYTVAGMCLERVNGKSWEEAVNNLLFKQLEMESSNTSLTELQERFDYSLPYAEIDGKIEAIAFRDNFSVNPGGGINSNILDMAKWLKLHLYNEELLSRNIATLAALQESHQIQLPFPSSLPLVSEDVQQIGYGLGWFIGKYRGHDLISHGGCIEGFESEVAILPKQKIGVVILTNSSSDGGYLNSCIRNFVIDKVLESQGFKNQEINWLDKFEKFRNIRKKLLRVALENFNQDKRDGSSHPLEEYVGCYKHPAYGTVDISMENDHLIASYGRQPTPLYFKSEHVFTGQFSELLAYGVSPLIDFKFFKDPQDGAYKVEIPFEGFRSLKPITFNLSKLP